MVEPSPPAIVRKGKFYQVMVGEFPLWDEGTRDFALMCAKSYLSGVGTEKLTGRPLLTIDPKTYKV